jgi:hypothetical protein
MRQLADRVEAARRSWNSGDLAGYLSLYDASIKLHGYTPEPMNKAAVTEFYETVCSALSDPGAENPRLEFHEVLVDGELYTCRFTMSGTHTGTFMGVPATNRPYSISGSQSCASPPMASVWSNASRRPTCSGCWCRSARCQPQADSAYVR